MPPVRNKVDIQKYTEKVKKKEEEVKGDIFEKKDAVKDTRPEKKGAMTRDKTNMFDYYKAWDKYAAEVDKESDSSDNEKDKEIDGFIPARNPKPEEEKKGPMSQAEMMKPTSGAKPNTKLVIKGGTVKKSTLADDLK